MPEVVWEAASIEKNIQRTAMRLQQGDLTALPVDAFQKSSSTQLWTMRAFFA